MADLIRWFTAQYRGECKACGATFEEGADVGYLNDELVGYGCCQGLGVPDPALPHGKTAQDRCDQCFLVHSSLQEDCE